MPKCYKKSKKVKKTFLLLFYTYGYDGDYTSYNSSACNINNSVKFLCHNIFDLLVYTFFICNYRAIYLQLSGQFEQFTKSISQIAQGAIGLPQLGQICIFNSVFKSTSLSHSMQYSVISSLR